MSGKAVASIVIVIILITAGFGWILSHPVKHITPPDVKVSKNVYYNDLKYNISFEINRTIYDQMKQSDSNQATYYYLVNYVDNLQYNDSIPIYNNTAYYSKDLVWGTFAKAMVESTYLWIFEHSSPQYFLNQSAFNSKYPAVYSGYHEELSQNGIVLGITVAQIGSNILDWTSGLIKSLAGIDSTDTGTQVENAIMVMYYASEGTSQVFSHYNITVSNNITSALVQYGVVNQKAYNSIDFYQGFIGLKAIQQLNLLNALFERVYGHSLNSQSLNLLDNFVIKLTNDMASMGLESFLRLALNVQDSGIINSVFELTSLEILSNFIEFDIPIALASAILTYISQTYGPKKAFLQQEISIESDIYGNLSKTISLYKDNMYQYVGWSVFGHNIYNVTSALGYFYSNSLMLHMTSLWYSVDEKMNNMYNYNATLIQNENATIHELDSETGHLSYVLNVISQAANKTNNNPD